MFIKNILKGFQKDTENGLKSWPQGAYSVPRPEFRPEEMSENLFLFYTFHQGAEYFLVRRVGSASAGLSGHGCFG